MRLDLDAAHAKSSNDERDGDRSGYKGPAREEAGDCRQLFFKRLSPGQEHGHGGAKPDRQELTGGAEFAARMGFCLHAAGSQHARGGNICI